MSKTRIYLVTENQKVHLVRAINAAAALRHVARHTMTAEVASQEALVTQLAIGIPVETAGEEAEAGEE